MTFNISDLPVLSTFRGVGTVDNTTDNPAVILTWDSNQNGPYKQTSNNPSEDILLTELPVVWSADVLGGQEQFYLTDGLVVPNKERQVQYTVSTRAPLNSDNSNPITVGNARNYKSHKNNAFITTDETWLVKGLKDVFTAGTVTDTAEAGEDLAAQDVVSIHTDSKVYKYHATNYPNIIGTVGVATTSGSTATYTTFGGVSTGHGGLTPGGDVYAENAGQVTQTASNTAKLIGVATNATSFRLTKIVEAPESTGDVFTTITAARDFIERGVIAGVNSIFPTSASSAQSYSWGDASIDYLAIPFVGSGVAMSSLDLLIYKSGASTGTVTAKIETDNNGENSGTLADPNATIALSGASFPVWDGTPSTNEADTFTFPGAFTLTDGEVYWLVIERSVDTDDYILPGVHQSKTTNANLTIARRYNGTTLELFENSASNYWIPYVANMAGQQTYSGTDYIFVPASDEYSEIHTFLGFSSAGYDPGDNAKVQIRGVSKGHSGLTAMRKYGYGTAANSLALGAGVGVAISATEMLIRKDTNNSNSYENPF